MRLFLVTLLCLASNIVAAQDNSEIETDLTCDVCHAGGDWAADIGKNFDHIITGFELQGTHGDIDCSRCHVGSTPAEKHNFGQVSSDCIACHEDIHNDQWGEDCERCHSPDTWTLSTQQQNHDLTNFPLQGPHRSVSCQSCHLSNPGTGSSLPLDCAGCHSEDYRTSSNPPHQTLNLGNDCEACHETQSTRWQPSSFNHNSTGFYLLGMHNTVGCESCHTGPVDNTPITCVGCHRSDYDSSVEPDHLASGYPTNCNSCHDSFTWNSNFTHDRTGFTLDGAHTDALCLSCHPQQSFYDAETNCNSCHLSDWESSAIPPHVDAEFDQTCEDCHTTVDWLPSLWNHDTDSEYPLTGAHIGPSCEACHTVAPYSEQPSECVDCHQTNYAETLEPNHATSGIPTTCEVCHTTENWESEEIDHTQTAFPLEGAHTEIECMTCHADGYDLPTECQGCHLPDYTATSNTPSPDHGQYGFSQDCLTCHSQVAWKPSSFDHDAELTGFDIQGAHLALLPENCFACHESEQWSGLSSDCLACHQSNFESTTDPDHEANGYPQNLCETCHSQDGWEPSIFSHEANSISCVTCHMVQYNSTIDPPHAELSFPTDCGDCHASTAWKPGLFAHDVETTGFLTDGAHLSINCSSCHENWDPPSEIRTCASASCHQDNYSDSSNPPHETMGFSQACETCHSTTAWQPSQFVHDTPTTGFVLDGAHESSECQSCHTPWEVIPQPRTCAASSCHLDNFSESINPPHETMSFSQNCVDCHTTSAWRPSNFQHSADNTGYPLEGAHTSVECQSCHETWQIFPQPRTCADASCHLPDYNSATDPNHLSASYPLDCDICHSMTAWEAVTFDHDGQSFPIYSGQHRNEWNDCSQCHVDANDFMVFTCFGAGCHSITEMNNEHCEGANCESCNGNTYPSSGVTPSECYTCHPTGDEDDCGGDLLNFFKMRTLPQPTEKKANENR